jgi:hypothetical protein
MKTTALFAACIALFLVTACEKANDDFETSACIGKQIMTFKKESSCSNASVEEYRFQQKLVYVFSPGNCGADLTARVLDSACNTLGILGGIQGNQIINNEPFGNAVLLRTVWKK